MWPLLIWPAASRCNRAYEPKLQVTISCHIYFPPLGLFIAGNLLPIHSFKSFSRLAEILEKKRVQVFGIRKNSLQGTSQALNVLLLFNVLCLLGRDTQFSAVPCLGHLAVMAVAIFTCFSRPKKEKKKWSFQAFWGFPKNLHKRPWVLLCIR